MLRKRYEELLCKHCSTKAEEQARDHELRWLRNEMIRLRSRQRYRYENSRMLFLQSQGYIIRDPVGRISSQDLYEQYCLWCQDHRVIAHTLRALTVELKKNRETYQVIPTQNIPTDKGTHVRGYRGLRLWREEDGPARQIDPEDLPGTYTPPETVPEDNILEFLLRKRNGNSKNTDNADK